MTVGISSVKVVPVLLVISSPKEQAGLVQLLLIEIHSYFFSNRETNVVNLTTYRYKFMV